MSVEPDYHMVSRLSAVWELVSEDPLTYYLDWAYGPHLELVLDTNPGSAWEHRLTVSDGNMVLYALDFYSVSPESMLESVRELLVNNAVQHDRLYELIPLFGGVCPVYPDQPVPTPPKLLLN